jgi:hypothetical protein
MKVIVFGHLRKPGEWMVEQINMQSPLHGVAVVTSGAEYVEVARHVKEFALVVGQYKMNEYEEAERLLASENIFPHRRVICAPVVTTQFLEWASEQYYDGVIDLIANQNTFGEEVYKAVMAPKGCSRSTVRFPLTSSFSGLIPFRDDTDGDIVRLITAGLNNNEIAERVFLSVQTVRNRISRLLEASGARNRTHLAAMYLIPYTSNSSGDVKPVLTLGDHLPTEPGIEFSTSCTETNCTQCRHSVSDESAS